MCISIKILFVFTVQHYYGLFLYSTHLTLHPPLGLETLLQVVQGFLVHPQVLADPGSNTQL